MPNEPFFAHDGDVLRPTNMSKGPWDATSLHGRVVIGILADAIEKAHGAPDFVPARLTVDLYRLPDLSPVTTTTKLVRDGRRIKVVDAEFFSGGVSMGRATCQLLLKTENPPGNIWSPPNWDAPPPESLPPPEPREGMGGMWETRAITPGGWNSFGKRRLWMREIRPLIDAEPMSGFVRLALAADFASPFANWSTEGLGYINSDATLYLHRPLAGEWIGFEIANHQARDGVAIGECWLYDVEGPLGTASVCAITQKRRIS